MVCLPIAVLRGSGGLLVPDFQVGVHYGGVLFFAIISGIPFSRFHVDDDAGSAKQPGQERSTRVGRDEGMGRDCCVGVDVEREWEWCDMQSKKAAGSSSSRQGKARFNFSRERSLI